jgi:apolipoprotein N-acyltransferase
MKAAMEGQTVSNTGSRSGFAATWLLAGLSALLGWAAFPPLGWYPLIFLAPVPLLWLADRGERLAGRDYIAVWLAGTGFWLANLQGVRLAYWPLHLGWLVLSAYLGVYFPLFVLLVRLLVERLHLPTLAVAPAVWISGELVRSYAFTGLAVCQLGHALAGQPVWLQIASQLGGYGVSALVMVGACGLLELARLCRTPSPRGALAAATAAAVLGIAWGYGRWELARDVPRPEQPLLRVGLVQENMPSQFESRSSEELAGRNQRAWQAYYRTTALAAEQGGMVDLLVWPESTFTGNEPSVVREADIVVPQLYRDAGWDDIAFERLVDSLEQTDSFKRQLLVDLFSGHETAPWWLLGTDLWRFEDGGKQRHNAAIWLDPSGQTRDHYAKQHLVMFGEYIPFGRWLPIIYRWLGLSPLDAGGEARAFTHPKGVIAPSICFENMLPHLVQRIVRQLSDQGESPDVLINVTNDSWFRGSAILDHHLACATLAAVENRRPMLVAANTGLSAWIDGSGRRQAIGPRGEAMVLWAEPWHDGRGGLWQSWGDWPLRLISLVVLMLAIVAWRRGPHP